jgi:hypothetical protein
LFFVLIKTKGKKTWTIYFVFFYLAYMVPV